MKTYLYDDRNSIIHTILGFASALLPYFLGILVFLIYLIYEVREPENPVSTIGDVVEYLNGFVIGLYVKWG